MSKKISKKDKKAWENFVNSNDKVPDKDQKLLKKYKTLLQKKIDLHGYTLDEANKKIENFILNCVEKGVTKINVITGKGSRSQNKNDPYQSKDLSILKYSIPNYINGNKNLMDYILKIDMVSIENPSKGSFDIFLRKKIY
mgnify:CR=1 FL=1